MGVFERNFCSLAFWLSFLSLAAHVFPDEVLRKFTTVINPGCDAQQLFPSNCSSYRNLSLIHIRSDGSNDSYHFLWSFIGAPTLLMARTSLNSQLNVDWVNFFEGSENRSVSFDPPPLYSFGWSITKVWLYNDTDDKVFIDKVNQSQVHDFSAKNFIWERWDNVSYSNSTDAKFTITATHYDHQDGEPPQPIGPEGYFQFTIRMKSKTAYSDVLPYMLYTENSTQLDIAFNDVQLNHTDKDYLSNQRVGFKYIFVLDHPKNSSEWLVLDRIKTLDDEHTPGVFETDTVSTPLINNTDKSYMQWKPICYISKNRDIADSVDVWKYDLQNASSVVGDDNVQDSMLYSFYGSNIDNLILESMNITFGTQKDGFYKKTKHISWTYATGFGTPPKDFVSFLVILVISIGLGIPALIILFSLVYLVVKRLKRPRDDLLLGG